MPFSSEVAERSARAIMLDAFEMVKKAHTGSIKNFLYNKGTVAIETMTRTGAASIAVTVLVSVGVGAAAAVTGGLAIPILLAIGAASYGLKTAIEKIGQDYGRDNRRWLQNYTAAEAAKGRELGAYLTVEASDSLRRAIDHYRMMDGISKDLQRTAVESFQNCEEAINYAKAMARYVHHADKVRNYTLPVLDLLIFYLDQYSKLATNWAAAEAPMAAALRQWFKSHPESICCPARKDDDVCYAPFTGLTLKSTATNLMKRYRTVTTPLSAVLEPVIHAPGLPNAVKIDELLEAMQSARQDLVGEMAPSSDSTWNYSADLGQTRQRANAAASVDASVQQRLTAMLNAVWKQVDRPGYFNRARRRMAHWNTRNTSAQKATAVAAELVSMGSIFSAYIGDISAVSKLGQSALKGTASAAGVGSTIGLNVLRGADGVAIQSSLLSHKLVEAHAAEQIREAGASAVDLLPKLMLHFTKAAEAIKALGDTTAIASCTEALAMSVKIAEIVRQMEKVSIYAGPCLGIVDVLAHRCAHWSMQQPGLWADMEASVGAWLNLAEGHETCREQGCHCYGAQHGKVGANLIGRGGAWRRVSDRPHNPIT
ncbi:hypothetical protein [Robbsia sp. KACC 23696]|uniref:hypothetical protein n=1 Tax=Robbsia sp. KACC 23696 TaxID=3149231 RepID=UPI00325B0757